MANGTTTKSSTTTPKATAAAPQQEYPVTKTNFDAYVGNEPYLFVSYSHRDTEKVYPILDALSDAKYRIWYDESCETGNDFRVELKNKIQNCSGILLFVSESSMNSPFCGMEIICAEENGKKIFPIYLGEEINVPPAFSIFLSNLHHSSAGDEVKMMASLRRDLPPETMDRLTLVDTDGKNDTLKACEDNGTSITIPDTVKTIGKHAFRHRSMLKEINLPQYLTSIEEEAFRSCSSLESIDIPEKTVRIGNSAFRDCISLKSLKISNPIIRIGDRAFENCASLENVSLPDALTEIYASVFNGCKSLAKIQLPSQLTVLGENAFGDCVTLEEVELPETIIKIDDLVFSGCSKMKKITLPEGLKKIGKAAFKNCTSLTTVFIPSSVSYLSTDLFRGCDKLQSIMVDPKNRYYKSEAHNGKNHVLYNKNKSMIISYPASSQVVEFIIPDSVTNISDWTFNRSGNLSRITIPDSVTEIGEGAFCECTSLNLVEIPDSVEKIDDCVFRGCKNLKMILIPASVKELGWGVFDDCSDELVVYCDDGSEICRYCERNKIKMAKICDWEA